MRKEIFQTMSSWSQLFFLGLFFFAGFVFVLAISAFCLRFYPDVIDSTNFLRFSVSLQSCALFLIPALFCAYLFNEHPGRYLKAVTITNFNLLILAIFVILAIQPVISFTAYINNQVELPQSMQSLQQELRLWENSAESLTRKLLLTNSTWILVVNILIVGVLAGITEEFFFRGSIQQLINKISGNKHVAIWITAFIFSAVHFQFFGFLPRLLLGALLGYLFVWSGNIWIPVITHAINNSLSVILFHSFHDTETYSNLENIGTKDTWWTAIISIVIVIFILNTFYRNRVKEKSENENCLF